MRDLKDGPQHLVLLLALVARVFGVLEFVLELKKCVFDVVEPLRWWLAILASGSYGRHRCCLN